MKSYVKYLFIIIAIFLISYPAAGVINLADGSYGLATGDVFELTGSAQGGSSGACLWLFTFAQNGNIYCGPINSSGGSFTSKVYNTKNLTVGKYKMVVEFFGANGIQEVIYDKTKNEISSPWRFVTPEKSSDNPYIRIDQIKSLCEKNRQYCDDTFLVTNVTIEKPFITHTEMYQYSFSDIYKGKSDEKDITKSGLLLVGGETNLNPSNQITVTLDYNQTVIATTKSNKYGYYTWSAYLNISKLRTGTHKILISTPKTDDMVTNLEIGYTAPTPKPTPTPIKVVSNGIQSSEPVIIGDTGAPQPVLTMIQQKKFVVVTTPTIIDTPISAIPGAITIAPKKTNVIAYSNVAADATPLPPSKIPIDPIYIIIGVSISIAMYVLHKKV